MQNMNTWFQHMADITLNGYLSKIYHFQFQFTMAQFQTYYWNIYSYWCQHLIYNDDIFRNVCNTAFGTMTLFIRSFRLLVTKEKNDFAKNYFHWFGTCRLSPQTLKQNQNFDYMRELVYCTPTSVWDNGAGNKSWHREEWIESWILGEG